MSPFVVLQWKAANLLFLATATRCLLGRLERVDLGVLGLDLDLYMGCEVAYPVEPFFRRRRISGADLSNGPVSNTLTSFAVFYNHLAGAAGEYTSLLPPERTLSTAKYGLTLHGFPPLYVQQFRVKS